MTSHRSLPGIAPLPKAVRTTLGTARTSLATAAARAATWASQTTGRGSGGMIGGLVAQAIDPDILAGLIRGRDVYLVTGTNGKSTTTKMLTTGLRTQYTVCTNSGGDNMDAGIIAALLGDHGADAIVLEVDELHVPHIAAVTNPKALVLLNLSRDQLDRVGEITRLEQALRQTVADHPDCHIIANCDDVAVTSVAYDAQHVTWVSVGRGWMGDAVSCPRTGSYIVHDNNGHWAAHAPMPDGRQFARPTPDYTVTDDGLVDRQGTTYPFTLTIPGRANRGNAAQAAVTAHLVGGIPLSAALAAVSEVADVAGRYATHHYHGHDVHMLLAKNPAGWQEALSMVDRSADGLVIAVNGQVADGVDLSWLWDVSFEDFDNISVLAAGERGTDLAVRLQYASISHELIHDPLAAIDACPPGRVEVLANYTAFRDLNRALLREANNPHATPQQADKPAHMGPTTENLHGNPPPGTATLIDSPAGHMLANIPLLGHLITSSPVTAIATRIARPLQHVAGMIDDLRHDLKHRRTGPATLRQQTPDHPAHPAPRKEQ
ncbi:UDP-N-acetylmuramate--L-alanine ligase [Corynebacterium choanae]|uniref:Lipid II isoglutaminyl synthase (glutamine-hydrolyzing) subunit MurT n=1 Tax=Corynebacterium choanae TaxID=1862358 RepID=A0A3G6J9Y2_9CORY|nr:UDP-N-acetylmuramate--L-alanine ligase [Corynebacterium choanae]